MKEDASQEAGVEADDLAQIAKTADADGHAESSTASGENHEQQTNGVQERINKITAQKYEEKRRADELQRQLDELKSQQPTQPVVQSDISPPTLPSDPYDDEAMKVFHEEMLDYTNKAAERAAKSTFENQTKAQLETEQKLKHQQAIQQYANNAIKDGVDLDKLRVAEQSLVSAGINPDVGAYLMSDPNGAKLVEYLADNPSEMYEVASMDAVKAGIHLATKIKPKALSTTPNVSSAPSPIPDIKGGGMVEVDEFDKKYPGAEFI